MKNQKGFSVMIGVFIVVFIAILGVAGYFIYKQYSSSKSQIQTQENNSNQTAGWKTYTDADYNFEFQYPTSWSVSKSSLPNSTDVQEIVDISKNKYVVEIYVDKLKDENKALPVLPITSITNANNQQLVRETQPEVEIVAGSDNYYFRVFSKNSAGVYANDIQNGAYYYSIFYRTPFGLLPTDYDQQVITEADRIISTFKFTNQ